MTILVTGGAGFIGSHVVDAYLAAGFSVAVVDDLSTGRRENVNPQARFYQVDIRDKSALSEVFSRERPRYVNHHAAHINLRHSVEDPLFDASVNILGTLNVLELAREFGVEKIVFASTGGALYGEVEELPVSEDYPPVPLSPYGVAKYAAECYLRYYEAVWGIPYVALRYGNVYGPRQDPRGEAGVVAIFSERILEGKPCVVFGDGTKTRDYVFVGDVARANLLALSAPSGAYNIGTGKETSVLELVALFERVAGRTVEVVFSEERKGEISRIALSIEKAKNILAWEPQVSLEEGLAETFLWFAEEMRRESHGS
ncbi:MAG: NAD-dependent epimerase/dehydratase family protein [Candidatus Caldatribacterium sp.]|nr:NAD-dependent epimerase/dehydratase family protein [Candidatus Caldatribacterium sp.]